MSRPVLSLHDCVDEQGDLLACANQQGIHIFDGPTLTHLRTVTTNCPQIPSLCFLSNSLLASGAGSPPFSITQTDLRAPLSPVRTLSAHRGPVASLSCAPVGAPCAGGTDNGQQLASGGLDKALLVWDARGGSGQEGRRPSLKLDGQRGPVLATAWSSHQRGVLASCGAEHATQLSVWDTKLAPKGTEPVTSAKSDTTVSYQVPSLFISVFRG